MSTTYIVFYDRGVDRPKKEFTDRQEALDWAAARPDKRPEVIQQVRTIIRDYR